MKLKSISLGQHASVLASRDTGRTIGAALADALRESSLLLDFTGVEVVTPPFLDEVLRAVHGSLSRQEPTRVLIVSGLNEDVRETLAIVLERAHMMLGSLDEDQLELLGGPEHLRTTLTEAASLGHPFDAPAIAERLKLKLPNVNARLTALVKAGVLVRERDPHAGRGIKYTYDVPSPEDIAETEDLTRLVAAIS